MSLPTSERARWALVVLAWVLLLIAFHAWWIAEFRHGYPLDIDEAGYTTIALADYFGLRDAGLQGWWDTIQIQQPHAPLVPALTSLVFVVKTGVMEGFAVLLGFLVILVFAAYGIGERLAGPRLGALAAIVVGASPGAIAFTREYIFALPTAAMLSVAVYALLRSEAMRKRRWAIACGAALALMVLARSMAIVFVPGVMIAASVAVLSRGRDEITHRLLNLVLLVLAGIAVAATWYARNIDSVIDYLTNYGYGSQSSNYGADHSLISWERWTSVAERAIYYDLLLPLTALVLAALVALLVLAVRRGREARGRGAAMSRLLGSDAFGVAVVIAVGFAALTTSRNGGTGFTLPISVLLPPLGVVALRHYRRAMMPVVAMVALIISMNLAATSNLWDSVSQTRLVRIPTLGWLPWVRGVPQAVEAIRVYSPGPQARFDDRDRGWVEANQVTVETISPAKGGQLLAALAVRNQAINLNTLQLEGMLQHHARTPIVELVPDPADSVSSYLHQLAEPGGPNALITMSDSAGDFPPRVDQARVEIAARRLHFQRIRAITLPNGRQLRLWVRRTDPRLASCGSSQSALGCSPGSPPG